MVTMKKSATMKAVKSLLLEWDGDGSGLEAVETAVGTLYKAADVIIQNEDIPGMTVTDNEGKETLVTDSVYNDMISRSLVGEGFAAKVAGLVWIAQKEAQAPGAKLPAGGIWLLKKQDGSYPKKVVLPAYREDFLQGEKPDGEKGESMGGSAISWNDLKDKPFGETTVKGDTLTWDGNTEGKEPLAGYFYKVTDVTPPSEAVKTGTVHVIGPDGNAGSIPFSENELSSSSSGGVILDHMISVYDIPVVMIVYSGENKGIWFASSAEMGIAVTALQIDGYSGFEVTEIDTIDPKFLPEALQFGEETDVAELMPETSVTITGREAMLPVAVVIELGKTYTVTWDGTEYECKAFTAAGLPAIGNPVELGGTDNGIPFLIGYMAAQGVTAIVAAAGTYTVSIKGETTTIKPIDPKFLPENEIGDGRPLVGGEVLPETTITVTNGQGAQIAAVLLVPGFSYYVDFDGVQTECVCEKTTVNGENACSLSGTNFSISYAKVALRIQTTNDGDHVISISEVPVKAPISPHFDLYQLAGADFDLLSYAASGVEGWNALELFWCVKHGIAPVLNVRFNGVDTTLFGGTFSQDPDNEYDNISGCYFLWVDGVLYAFTLTFSFFGNSLTARWDKLTLA